MAIISVDKIKAGEHGPCKLIDKATGDEILCPIEYDTETKCGVKFKTNKDGYPFISENGDVPREPFEADCEVIWQT